MEGETDLGVDALPVSATFGSVQNSRKNTVRNDADVGVIMYL